MTVRQTRFIRPGSLAEAARREIERLIVAGDLPPGERINELHLARSMGISRGPVREALREMKADGLLRSEPNRGVYVQAISAAEALEAFGERSALCCHTVREVVRKPVAGLVSMLRQQVEDMQLAADHDDHERYYDLNDAFHTTIVDAAGNRRISHNHERTLRDLRLYRMRTLVHGRGLKKSNEEHRAIVDAIAAGDADRAGQLMEDHIWKGREQFISRPGNFNSVDGNKPGGKAT